MEYLQRVTETIREMSNNCKIKSLCSVFHIRRATEQAAFQALPSHILSEVIVFYFTIIMYSMYSLYFYSSIIFFFI